MYFNSKNSTNIDDEFEKNKGSKFFEILKKYKLFIIIALFILLMIFGCIFLFNNKEERYFVLKGEDRITIYKNSEYIEPGYNAYSSKDKDLNEEVVVDSNLNTKEVGEYQITYKFGNLTKIRTVKVIEQPKDYTYIYLNSGLEIYLSLGEEYVEPGYMVFSSDDGELNDKVVVSGSVDSKKIGIYKLTYSVVDSKGITVSKSRLVYILGSEINLSLDNNDWTKNDVTIKVNVVDNFFDYMILPDGSKISKNMYSYKVSSNGKYTFKTRNKRGVEKEASIEVKNIDREAPSGSCVIGNDSNGSFITVNAKDYSGIVNYVYNGKSYKNAKIVLDGYVDNALVSVYDKVGNKTDLKCKNDTSIFISNISVDGVIVKINAKKTNSKIKGYYFSYTNKRPDRNGGYLATDKETIDVVRLPGTTYVWVEDASGKISSPKSITIQNSSLLMTKGSDYTILKNPSLEEYLSNKGWSLTGFNNLLYRSVRAAGLYTGEAAATSALGLTHVLAQKYKIKLPYESAGLHTKHGAKASWGSYGYNSITKTSGYYGLDCSAFVNWVYANAGFGIDTRVFYWGSVPRVDYTKENGEVGDVLVYGYGEQSGRHVRLIIGKTDTAFITAEASGGSTGIVISTYPYSNANGYKIQKSSNFTDLSKNKNYYKLADYPSGF